MNDEYKAQIMLSSLPPSFEHVVITLVYDKDTISLREVMATLLSNEYGKKPIEVEALDKGLVAHGKAKAKGIRKNDVKCYYCH